MCFGAGLPRGVIVVMTTMVCPQHAGLRRDSQEQSGKHVVHMFLLLKMNLFHYVFPT